MQDAGASVMKQTDWMDYLFGKSQTNPDGTITIPAWAVNRWLRQMMTPYEYLPEAEKDLDRAEADKILALINDPPA
jgi:hypothetical protein